MSSVKVLCADLSGLIKRMVCALCETNITFRHSIEITGSLHIKADETRVLALLLDHVASKPPAAGNDVGEAGAGAGSGDRLSPSSHSAESPGGASPPAYGTAFVQQHRHSRRRADDSSPPQQQPRLATRSPLTSPHTKQPAAHTYSRGSCARVAGGSGSNSGGSSAPRFDLSHHSVPSHHRMVSAGRPDGSKSARLPSADAAVATVTSAHEWWSPGDSAGRTTPSHDAAAAFTATSATACSVGPTAASGRHRAGSLEPSIAVSCSSATSGLVASTLAMQPLTSPAAGPAMPLSQLVRRLSENPTATAVQSRVSGGCSSSGSGSYCHGQGAPPATSDARELRRGDPLARDGGQDGRHHHERGAGSSSALTIRPPQRPVGLASPPQQPASLHQLYGVDSCGSSASGGVSAVASSSSSVSAASAAGATRPVPPLGSWVHAYRNAYQKAHRKTGLSCHTCTLCGMHFQRAPSLAAHINAIHTRERSFKCELCGKVFFRRTAYCNHRRTHHQPGGGAAAAALGSAVMALAESMQLSDGAGYADGADEGDGGSNSGGGMDVSPPGVTDDKDGLLGRAAAAAAGGAEEGSAYDAATLADTTGGSSGGRGHGGSDRADSPSDDSVGSEPELHVTTAKQEY